MNELFNLLIVQPCKKLPENSAPFTILFDALDQCEQAQEFSAAIEDLWGDVPKFVSLIVSSRPLAFVQNHFKGYNPLFLEPTDDQNKEDLKLILEKRLKSWGVKDEVLLNQLIEALLFQSQGLFLWLAFQQVDLLKLANENKLTVGVITTQCVQNTRNKSTTKISMAKMNKLIIAVKRIPTILITASKQVRVISTIS